MLIYQSRDIFFQALHPATTLAYLAVVVAGSVLLTHPLYLLALFLSVFAALAASGGMEDWRKSVRLFFTFMAVLMVINTMINKTGSTVLFGAAVHASGQGRYYPGGHNLCSGDGNPLADRLYLFYAF